MPRPRGWKAVRVSVLTGCRFCSFTSIPLCSVLSFSVKMSGMSLAPRARERRGAAGDVPARLGGGPFSDCRCNPAHEASWAWRGPWADPRRNLCGMGVSSPPSMGLASPPLESFPVGWKPPNTHQAPFPLKHTRRGHNLHCLTSTGRQRLSNC